MIPLNHFPGDIEWNPWLILLLIDFLSSFVHHTHTVMGSVTPAKSFFSSGSLIPPDSIFEVTKAYNADKSPNKVNLGQGAYRDGDGKPWVLPSVQLAKEKVRNCGHEYLPIAGLKDFRDRAVELVFHGSKALREDRVGSIHPFRMCHINRVSRSPLASLSLEQDHFFSWDSLLAK